MPGRQPKRDHYAVLGVPSSASVQQITSAYRRLVRSLHPDTRPEDPAAAADLADVLAAYDALRDPGRRAAYDAGRSTPAPPAAAGRPVPVRVTRVPAKPRPPSRVRRENSSLLGAPEERLLPLFPLDSRLGPRFAVRLEWDDRGFVRRAMQQWLRQTDGWLP